MHHTTISVEIMEFHATTFEQTFREINFIDFKERFTLYLSKYVHVAQCGNCGNSLSLKK